MSLSRFSAFDKTVAAAIGVLLLLIGATIWRGDQVGARTIEGNTADSAAASSAGAPSASALSVTTANHIAFLALDSAGMNQVRMAAINAPDAPPNAPAQMTSGGQGVWDFVTNTDRTAVIYSALRADGGADFWQVRPNEAPAGFLACAQAACSTPAFAADGALMAYSQRNVTGQGLAMINPPRIWLLDVATGETAPLFQDSQKLGFDPAFSHRGEWLSWVSPQPAGIGAINLQSGEERFFADGTGENGVWHPHQNDLVMTQVITSSSDYPTHLVLYNASDGTRTDLSGADAAVQDDSPAWSPDGAWIAFRRKVLAGEAFTPGKQIWLMRADGGEAHALTSDADYDHAPPQWSPDGTRLTFHRYNLRNAPIVIRVMVYDLENGAYWEAANPGQEPLWMQ